MPSMRLMQAIIMMATTIAVPMMEVLQTVTSAIRTEEIMEATGVTTKVTMVPQTVITEVTEVAISTIAGSSTQPLSRKSI